MTLADYIKWLFNIFQNYLPTFFEAFHLNLYDFTNAFPIFFDVFDAIIVLDHARDSKI